MRIGKKYIRIFGWLMVFLLMFFVYENQSNVFSDVQGNTINDKPCIAIVIDDFGYSHDHIVEGFLSFDVPLNYAVIPGHNYSRQFAKEAHAKGFEILVHMPMESHGNTIAKEPKELQSSMTPFEMENEILSAFYNLPEAVGMNNHQGSKLTEMEWAMNQIGQTLKRKNKYFLDSRTSPNSVAESVMKKLNVRTGKRHLFLDNEQNEKYVIKKIDELMEIAESNGSAIGIGHVKDITLGVLKSKLPEVIQNGFRLCFVSEILN